MKAHAMILGAAVSLIAFGARAQTPFDDRPVPAPERPLPTEDRPTYTPPGQDEKKAERDVKKDAAKEKARIADAQDADRKESEKTRPPSWIGITVMAGGGGGSFFDDDLAGQTSATGMWQVRAVVGSRRHFAGEMAYVGGAQNVNTLGVNQGARMINNGFEGAFRWNVLTGILQPYALGGIGYQHYKIADEQVITSDVQSYGDVLNFPLAVGVALKPGPFTLDGRVTFRPATNSGLLRSNNMSTWDIGANAGFEF
jgi:hypothetical protein